jgi:hypothetical protein
VAGNPHVPPNPKTRMVPAESAGPPLKPTGSLVSTNRHGASE